MTTDDKDSSEPGQIFRKVFAQQNDPPTVEKIHATFVALLQEMGLPADLLDLDVVVFRRALSEETDRGVALFAAAHLDDRLKNLLQSFLLQEKAIADPLFKNHGALANFSSRIDISYLLGLIPSSARHDLHTIRKIRNDFAHVSQPIDFSHQSITSRCDNLKRISTAKTSRDKFIQSAMSCSGIIDGVAQSIKRELRPRCVPAPDKPPQNASNVMLGLDLFASKFAQENETNPTTSTAPSEHDSSQGGPID